MDRVVAVEEEVLWEDNGEGRGEKRV